MQIDSYTKLFLTGIGSNGGTTFTDTSGTGKSPSGNTGGITTSTSQYRLNSSSIYVPSYYNYLSYADSADWNLASSAFTIGFWIYPVSWGSWSGSLPPNGWPQVLMAQYELDAYYSPPGKSWYIYLQESSQIPAFYVEGSGIWVGGGAGVALNKWTHVAIIRGVNGSVNNYVVCVNGVPGNIFTYTTAIPDMSTDLTVGGVRGIVNRTSPQAYYQNVELSLGVARWPIIDFSDNAMMFSD